VVWRAEDPQGNEAAKIMWEIVPYTRGTVLDLGCGPSKAFPHFVGVDSGIDEKLFGIKIRPDILVDSCEDMCDFHTESCDAVFSSHLLEHIVDYRDALKQWWRLVKVGGYMVLYLPHRNYYPHIGAPGSNPDHKHDFLPTDIIDAMRDIPGWDLVENQDRNGGTEYSFLLVFQKRDKGQTYSYLTRKKFTSKTACVVRYGGFGDMIQATNILPALRRQGYRVTVMTTPKGQDIIKEDPNVNDWYIQDNDQVPNHMLSDFWDYQSKKFDKFINLSESVEGTLLAMPGRANHMWPHEVRHKYLNLNYLEFTAELAGVPYKSEARFYPTIAENITAGERLLPGGLNIMWALAGSSVHKFYPWQDAVIARLLTEQPNCRIFLTGEPTCKILEVGWEKEPRIVPLAGELSIRDTLALARRCDVVVGPETGVLNAVAFENNRKVVLLSHSSIENLPKHWTNTAALSAPVPCYPCHRMHYTREFCPEDKETGASVCQRMIDPGDVFSAIVFQEKVAA
jgi:ADP-heptose:LPS heptosyltransferase/predicted SAM-dependent methyltransferase